MKLKKLNYKIPFNKPYLTGKEIKYIQDAHRRGALAGDSYYTKLCNTWIQKSLNVKQALLTHSCTAALEMMAILVDVRPGDEIIMPSYTFVSTANAFVLRGGVPVFIDVRDDTFNINEKLIESAITKKTKAILPVHYAGVSCEIETIKQTAKKYNLLVLEDAAQAFFSKYNGKFLGTIGDIGAISFHETKNIISGEGGVILINDNRYIKRAEIIREKGTNRSQFFRGQADKYTWVDVGSSYLPGELIAAFLLAQLEKSSVIIKQRMKAWEKYHCDLNHLESRGYLKRPIIPRVCDFNAHMYYIVLNDLITRTKLIKYLAHKKIHSVFHYIPLHSSPAGKKYGRSVGKLKVTDMVSNCLLRLPLFNSITNNEIEFIVSSIYKFFKQ